MNILHRIVSDAQAHQEARADEARGVNLGDVLVLLMGGALFLYTAYQSWRFLMAHTRDDFAIVPLAGLWGLDFGFITWSVVWMHYAKSREQDWIALTLAALDFLGIVLTVLLENVSALIPPEIRPLATFVVYVIILANVVSAAAYHAFSPETRLGRLRRKAAVALEHERQLAQNLLEAERLQAEYAQRILAQRDQLIELKEKMARQKIVLDLRDSELVRMLGRVADTPSLLAASRSRAALPAASVPTRTLPIESRTARRHAVPVRRRQKAMTAALPLELEQALYGHSGAVPQRSKETARKKRAGKAKNGSVT